MEQLDLRRPIYRKTAAFGHFGRTDPDFTWERTDRAAALQQRRRPVGDRTNRARDHGISSGRRIVVVVAAAAVLAAATLLVLPAAPARRWPAPRGARPLREVRGVFHVHTTALGRHRHDGRRGGGGRARRPAVRHRHRPRRRDQAARPAGLPITACCASTPSRSARRGGHYAALGLGQAPYPLAGEPRDVVEDVRRLGGFGIVTHPLSPKARPRVAGLAGADSTGSSG